MEKVIIVFSTRTELFAAERLLDRQKIQSKTTNAPQQGFGTCSLGITIDKRFLEIALCKMKERGLRVTAVYDVSETENGTRYVRMK